jgi:hypothetical protein
MQPTCALLASTPPPGSDAMTAMHIEMRVRRQDGQWELRTGACGRTQVFPTRDAALASARLAARLAWMDRRVPACVRLLGDDGAWTVDTVYEAADTSPAG